MASAVSQALRNEPGWPAAQDIDAPSNERVTFLIDASSRLERQLIEAWIARHRPDGAPEPDRIEIPPSRRRRPGSSLSKLDACLASGDDLLLAPMRVAWLPRKRHGVRAARLSDLLRLRDPRDPGLLRQHVVLRRESDRCRIVAGEPATADELRARWRSAGGTGKDETGGLAEFVAALSAAAHSRGPEALPMKRGDDPGQGARPWATSQPFS